MEARSASVASLSLTVTGNLKLSVRSCQGVPDGDWV